MRSPVSLIALALAISSPAWAQAPADVPVADAARAHPTNWPHAASPDAMSDARTEAFVTELMSRMTLEEKVGQVIQGDISSVTPQDLLTYPLGSILAGGNSSPGGDERAAAQAWVDLARAYREANAKRGGTAVPLIFGIDAVHGHNNIVGATLFPHNVGLGAARDPDLIRRIGEATALEVAATGADWTFGPTLAVPRDDRWGRAYEGYAEDPEVARSYAGPMTLGLQGALTTEPMAPGRIAGSAKHYLADGGTDRGRDQGDFIGSEQDLVNIHLSGYTQAIDAGVLSIMASFSSWNGVKHSANETILRDVLHGPLGFDGFVVSDWNAHGQIPGCSNESCPQAFNAGIDMFMAPDSWKALYDNTLAQARSGEISEARLDEAVRRILRAKVKTGVFREERPVEGRLEVLGSPEHRALAREAVRKSLVLIKNEDGVLPIRPGARVLVAGTAADDIGQAAGGWTLTWQGVGNTNADFPNAQSIWGGIEEAVRAGGGTATLSADGTFEDKPDVAIVVFGETPYAEFQGDIEDLDFKPEEPLAVLKRLQAAGVPTVSVFLSGRPMWTNPEINASDAFVAAWLPGSEGGGLADVLISDGQGRPRHDFSGKLGFSWPKDAAGAPLNRGQPGYDPQFAYGYGLSYARPAAVGALSEDSGVAGAASSLTAYFIDGRIVSPWSLALEDSGGQTRVGAEKSVASPRGGVTLTVVDDLAQESARRFAFTGGEGQRALIWGGPVDLSRQSNGEMALAFRYRVDASPQGRVTLASGQGGGRGAVDLTDAFRTAPIGEWRTLKVRLSCFGARGADLAAVERPFELESSGAFTVSVSEIELASNEGDAVCPAT
ncbi:glycoside hydrolase family 3 protein [Brevundimonas sp. Root1279]|uniref:glycoside hydrolase family 3 protein n=1 Tax=Brevundimonas sp. Root1279 TaxID=1736443 RepID=UPI00070049E5|nr:exo 1,3/1,4-beta-D-glucan glucohydrolase [Brevundimonas sp. Root1279]KQW78764.1 1,4-beta-D-glucan glucohydrolase [Brevundimonas sp. Root1279]